MEHSPLYKAFYSIVLLIGVGIFGISLSSILSYLAGNQYLTRWMGTVPMAFSTSVMFMFTGLALFLIGKIHLMNGKANRQG